MIVRKIRLQRGWSQEQLSEFSGLSIRTIQRIERGQKASMESLKSLAAVFEVELSDLEQETQMDNHIDQTQQHSNRPTFTYEEEKAFKYVKDIKDFYSHLMTYIIVMLGLCVLNYITAPNELWVIFPALGWGIGLACHAISVFEVFNIFSPEWEKKQIEKRLGRRL